METCSREFCYKLPKAELHLHLEGTLEPDLKLKLAKKNNVELKQNTVAEIQATYNFNDLPSFLDVYYSGMSVLQTENDFYELATEYLKKAQANGVKRVEAFFDPQAHTTRGVAFADVINGYYRAISEAHKYGIDAHLILCFLRDMSAESAMETLKTALPYKDKFIGVGLDSDEKSNPPSKFAEVYKLAKAEGLRLTMHCDVDQENSIEHIRQVLEDIKVERIDHGTNILENPDLVKCVAENKIPLTSCPLSNGFVAANMKGDLVQKLLATDVLVTLNSDDPAYFGGYIGDNFYELAKECNLSAETLVKLAKNSFYGSWCSNAEKEAYLKQVDDFVESFTE